MRGFFRRHRADAPPGQPYDRAVPGGQAGPAERTAPSVRPGARTHVLSSGGADEGDLRPRGPGARGLLAGGLRARGIRTGLRWKLSAAIALVGALVAIVLSLVVHNAARVSMLDNARDLADDRVLIAQRNYELSGRQNFPNAQIDDPDLPPELRRKVEAGRRATYVSEQANGVTDIWAAVPLKDGHVMSLHSGFTDRSADILGDLDQALVIGSIAVVLGGSALGVLIGGQLSRRLRKAAAAANRVAGGEADVRVRDAIGGVVRDETDDVARAVDAMADALQQRIEAERRVTADIAHELRTPVTGLLTAAELLPPGRPTELVLDRAKAMRTLVEDVLEVARLDGASERAELQDIMLGHFVSRRVAAKDPSVEVRVIHESEVTTDPRRLERVLFNLLANAARHGRAPVEVSVEGRVIRVRDHGPGFPEDLLAEGPSRFRTGSTDRAGRGHGLGLTIAAGQARVLGARLTFRNVRPAGAPAHVPAEGAVAVLWLPEHAPTNTGSYPMLPDRADGGPSPSGNRSREAARGVSSRRR
ncbi:HAMP domain-containing histidine kinase [Streptomyces sp. HB-N217]|uniref:two-component system sensor histidine kinase CseC n=1 Tax=Streptomyces sp. HB-N217 TaxID=2792016 RepID=UPI0018D61462|nr:two-component system sensor histidine kinase CseC [Streptomyces sp. HB-N217]MBH5133184.1 HAMP domain-containing histidine kinase [Streptomyces sp. HB-N217]